MTKSTLAMKVEHLETRVSKLETLIEMFNSSFTWFVNDRVYVAPEYEPEPPLEREEGEDG